MYIERVDNAARADVEVTLAGAAILAEKARIGSFPAVVPNTPFDPFSGKPLGYKLKGGNGFIVYSVELAGHFAGATASNQAASHESYFRYPTPAPKPLPREMLK